MVEQQVLNLIQRVACEGPYLLELAISFFQQCGGHPVEQFVALFIEKNEQFLLDQLPQNLRTE